MSLIVGYDISLPVAQNYSGLQLSVKNWLNRSDLTALIPDFITLAEEKLNRSLRVRQMEVDLPATEIVDGAIAVPVGTVGVKTLWIANYERTPLTAQLFSFIKSRGTQGVPTQYAWQGDTFRFDGQGTVQGVLYQRIPSLSATNLTNWLLTESPSAYLCATLREAFDYVRNDQERDRWSNRLDQIISELGGSDKRDLYSGPLQVRTQ